MRFTCLLKMLIVVAILSVHQYSVAVQPHEFHLCDRISCEWHKQIPRKFEIPGDLFKNNPSAIHVWKILDRCGSAGTHIVPPSLQDIYLKELLNSPLVLHVAAASGLDILVKLLIKERPDLISERDGNRRTPLYYAVKYDRVTTVRLLIENGSEAGQKAIDISTAFDVVAGNVPKEIAEILIGKMEDLVYEQDANGRTLLHMAVQNEDIGILRKLLENKPQVNALDLKGTTPMDIAVCYGHFEHAKLLAKKGGVITEIGKNSLLEGFHLYQPLLLYGPNAIRIDNLAGKSLFGYMSSKTLNMGTSAIKDILTEVKFELINGEPGLFQITFLPNQKAGKAHFIRTMNVKAVESADKDRHLIGFKFIERKQGNYEAKRSSAFEGDQIYKKVKGTSVRNDKIVLYEKEIAVEYSKDYQSITLKFDGTVGGKKHTENVLLSRNQLAPQETPRATESSKSPQAHVANNSNQSNTSFDSSNIPSINRPTLNDLVGRFYGKASNGWDIISASIEPKNEGEGDYQLVIATQNQGSTAHDVAVSMDGNKVAKLTFPGKKMQFHNWLFLTGFDVEQRNEHIILTCNNAQRVGRVKQHYSFTLNRSSSVLEHDLHKENVADSALAMSRAGISNDARGERSRQDLSRDDVLAMEGISKRQQKKEAKEASKRKILLEAQSQPYEAAWYNNLPSNDVDEERNRRYREQTQKWIAGHNDTEEEQDKSELSNAKNRTVKPPRLPTGTDWNELAQKQERKIKLKPSSSSDCPLLEGVWYGDGYTDNGDGLKPIPNKRLVLSLKNVKGLPHTSKGWGWGSLWASSLGSDGNFSLGKDVHWSYHHQDDGTKFLNISHHYLFEVTPSKDQDYDFELHLTNDDKSVKHMSDVTMFKVKRATEEKISDFAARYLRFTPDLAQEESMEKEKQEISAMVQQQLIGKKINDGQKEINYNIHIISRNYGVLELLFEENSENNNNASATKTKLKEFTIDNDGVLELLKK